MSTEPITVDVDAHLLGRIDANRGSTPRAAYILSILQLRFTRPGAVPLSPSALETKAKAAKLRALHAKDDVGFQEKPTRK